MPTITPCTYANQERLGVHFTPANTAKATVLLLAPMFEERRSSQRIMADFCKALCLRDTAALLPDLYGCGNSIGTLEEAGFATWRQDIKAAIKFLTDRHQDTPLFIVGCRLGALLAAWYCGQQPTPAKRLILWNPVDKGRDYLNACRKRRLLQDSITGAEKKSIIKPLKVEGEFLSQELYDNLSSLNLGELTPPEDTRILQSSFNHAHTSEVKRLLQAWKTNNVKLKCVVGQPFWNAHAPREYPEITKAAVNYTLE